MSDGREDDDVAWLLARARGQRGPDIAQPSQQHYEKLEALLEDLPVTPTGAAPPEGWQDRVLAAIDEEDAAGEPSADVARAVP